MEGLEYCYGQCIGCETKHNDDYEICSRCSRLEGPPPLEEVNNEEQNFEAEAILNHLRDKYTGLDVELEIGKNYEILKDMVNEILKNGGSSREY